MGAHAVPLSISSNAPTVSLATVFPGQQTTLTYTLSGMGGSTLQSVTLDLMSGADVAKSLSIPAGQPGAVIGTNTLTLNYADLPPGGPYTIRVTPVCGSLVATDWTRVTSTSDPNLKFNGPRGLDINRRVGSPYYGRIYVTEGTAGAAGGRTTSKGLYIYNPDLTPAFSGPKMQTANFVAPLTTWYSGSSHSPFRVYVAPDDTVFVTDAADAHPAVFFVNPDGDNIKALQAFPMPPGGSGNGVGLLKDANGVEVMGDTTSIWVEGSGANRKVYQAIQEIAPTNCVWSYDIPDGTENFVGAPTLVYQPILSTTPGSGTASTPWYADFVRDSAGNGYTVNFNKDSNFKWDTFGGLAGTLPATNTGMTGICIDDAKDIILMCGLDGKIYKTNKAFDAVTPIISGLGATNRDVALDGDGWIYVANETDKALEVFAPAGTYPVTGKVVSSTQTLSVYSVPTAGDIYPVGPAGIYFGLNGSRFGDGKVDMSDAIYSLRVFAGISTLP
ncbi:MAG TPA: hypothetical protein VGM37_09520 [Armatimonadota bacterium]|jgi:hypothetical protein